MEPNALLERKRNNILKTLNRQEPDFVPTMIAASCATVAWAGQKVTDIRLNPEADIKAMTDVFDVMWTDGIKIVALSGVLTLALDSMRDTVSALKAAGLEDVKVIVGGNPVTEEASKVIGADEWAYSPQKTVSTCKAWANA